MPNSPPPTRDIPAGQLTECLLWLLATVPVSRAQWIVAQLTERVERKRLRDIFAVQTMSENEVLATVGGNNFGAAALAVLSPAGAATLLAISARDGTNPSPTEVEAQAIRAVWDRLQAQLAAENVRFVQASSDSSDDEARLAQLGFQRLADLALMILEPAQWPKLPAGSLTRSTTENLDWQVVGDDSGRLVAVCQVAEQSFAQTKDCPRLGEFRSAAEIVAGYRESAQFDPSLWHLLSVDGEPVGCLFLTAHPVGDNGANAAIEIAYMGLLPAYRQRGLGRVLLDRAIDTARQRQASRMVLAVDRENCSALDLYRRGGWTEAAAETVWGFQISP